MVLLLAGVMGPLVFPMRMGPLRQKVVEHSSITVHARVRVDH
jgi:hypothetical protein